MRPTKDAVKLIHDGALALAEVEATGIRIDVKYLEGAIGAVEQRVHRMRESLRRSKVFRRWRKHYGQKTNINSRAQLGHVLFELMDFPCEDFTTTGKPSTEETALEKLDLPFVKNWLGVARLEKMLSTNLRGIHRELAGNRIHPFFNIHNVLTYRSSSDSINFQNLPNHNPFLNKMVRRCFIPDKDSVLLEIDYGAMEFRCAACFWKDPKMVAYASDNDKDIHRDMAMKCFKVPREEVSKPARQASKNKFVFPQLYGDFYVNCAKNMWNDIELMDIKTTSGVPMKKHLRSKDVLLMGRCDYDSPAEPGTFESHMKKVETEFYDMFPVFAKQRPKWWDQYCKRGWFQLMTGFVVQGVYSRNQVYNFPVQGPAFHCLLWSLIRMVWALRKMKSKVIGEIHDSILLSCHKSELEDVIGLATKIMTEDVRRHWKWIVTPLEIEVEIAEKNWHDKKELDLKALAAW